MERVYSYTTEPERGYTNEISIVSWKVQTQNSWHLTIQQPVLATWCPRKIEGLRERTEYLDIFLFSAHHSMVFYFWCSVYW